MHNQARILWHNQAQGLKKKAIRKTQLVSLQDFYLHVTRCGLPAAQSQVRELQCNYPQGTLHGTCQVGGPHHPGRCDVLLLWLLL